MHRFFVALVLVLPILAAAARADDRADMIERRLAELEEALSPITARAEETARAQRRSDETNAMAIKDMRLQLSELRNMIEDLRFDISGIRADIAVIRNRQYDGMLAGVGAGGTGGQAAATPPAPGVPPAVPAPNPTPPAPVPPVAPAVSKTAEEVAFLQAGVLFDEQKYADAALRFMDNMKAYPNGAKFYDNMFYLGLSLGALGRKDEACRTYKTLLDSDELLEGEMQKRAQAVYAGSGCDA